MTPTTDYTKSSGKRSPLKRLMSTLSPRSETAFHGSTTTTLVGIPLIILIALIPAVASWELATFLGTTFSHPIIPPIYLAMLVFVVAPASVFAFLAIIVFPIARIANIALRRFAMATANPIFGSGYKYIMDTRPPTNLSTFIVIPIFHFLIIEPLFLLKKAVQAITFVLNKALGANVRWISEQESYYRDQMEVARHLLLYHPHRELSDYLFYSSYGMHYTSADEISQFIGDRPAIAQCALKSPGFDLSKAKRRWEAGTSKYVLDLLQEKFGKPNWMIEYDNARTDEERVAALTSPGPCKLQNGKTIKGMTKTKDGTTIWDIQ